MSPQNQPQPPVGTPPAPAAVPPAADLPPSNPLEFGVEPPAPTPPAPAAPPADEVPAWAKEFMSTVEEKLNGFVADAAPAAPPADPNAPIGSTAPTESELAKLNPQSWEDVDKYVNERIQQGVKTGIDQLVQNATAAQQEEARIKSEVDAELDAAVDKLQGAGVIPAITNPNDRNDAGRVARRELYGMAAKLNTTDLEAVATLALAPLHAQGKMYDPITDSVIDNAGTAPAPGANAPIGSSTTTTGQTNGIPDYATIRKARSFDELRARAGM